MTPLERYQSLLAAQRNISEYERAEMAAERKREERQAEIMRRLPKVY